MAAQEHVALVRSLFELRNHRQSDPAWLEKCMAAFAADAEVIDVPSGTTFYGPEGYKRLELFLVETFPDLGIELTTVFATEEQVVLEGMFRGTSTGSRTLPTGALKALGRSIEPRCCFVWQLRHGKIASVHAYYDLTTLLEQLSLQSATAQAT